jgi:hypothetical protein
VENAATTGACVGVEKVRLADVRLRKQDAREQRRDAIVLMVRTEMEIAEDGRRVLYSFSSRQASLLGRKRWSCQDFAGDRRRHVKAANLKVSISPFLRSYYAFSVMLRIDMDI